MGAKQTQGEAVGAMAASWESGNLGIGNLGISALGIWESRNWESETLTVWSQTPRWNPYDLHVLYWIPYGSSDGFHMDSIWIPYGFSRKSL